MGLFDFLKRKESSFEVIQKGSSFEEENDKIIFDKTFLIVGERYECRKNKKHKRSDVIKKTRLYTPVRVEKYTYRNKPAYMIVNADRNLDIGVLSQGAADWLSDYYKEGCVKAKLVDKYNSSFHVQITVQE